MVTLLRCVTMRLPTGENPPWRATLLRVTPYLRDVSSRDWGGPSG